MQLQHNAPFLLHDFATPCGKQTADNKSTYALFECFCGKTFFACTRSVQKGHTRSCGCINESSTFGYSSHILYKTWLGIINRTTNPKHKSFANYGARGITVCDEWKDISNFITDMYPSYEVGLTIDRIDNDGNYEPSNCRWTTKSVQSMNTRVIRSNNTSGYRGVSWNKQCKKWIAVIVVYGKRIHLGSFDNALEAAMEYDYYIISNNLDYTINNVGI
jgi:hypothetical protein